LGQHAIRCFCASAVIVLSVPLSSLHALPADDALVRQQPTQGGTLTGRVTDARTTQGVPSATIEIDGTRLGAITDEDGRYRIANVPAGSRTVVARRLGFAAMRRTLTITAGQETTADFALEASVVALDQIVVTGTAGAEQRRSIGQAVATIDASQELSKSAAPDIGTLLNARAPGVVINQPSGRLGAGPSIQVRGRSSIGLGNSPVIYIDGVRVNNNTGTGPAAVPGGLAGQNSGIAGRLNDIVPEDIESIEVIKGPAASTLYGTEASAGVIQILTKRGSGGTPQFALQVQGGSIFFRDAEGRMPTNFVRDPSGTIVPWNAIQQEKDRGDPLFETGYTSLVNASVSGGQNAVRYYLSGAFESDQGVEPNNALRQLSLHGNLDVTPTPTVDIATSLNYVSLRNHLGVDVGASAMLGATVGHALAFPNSRGFGLGFPPEVTQELWDNYQSVNRFTTSSRIEHTPVAWFRHRLVGGLDYAGDDSRALERFALPPWNTLIPNATGRIGQTLRNSTGLTLDYTGTGTFNLTPALVSATSVGGQYFRNENTSSFLGGIGFPGPGIVTVSGTGQSITPTQSEVLTTTLGAFAQQKFSWRDRLFVTAALRVDNNSAFGEDLKWVTYPKFDASWVVSEESFWPWKSVLPSFRVRGAYGESGRAPQTFSALRTFSPVQGPGGTNAVTPGSIGNPDLKPERGKEIELGFETAISDRVSLDFTYFNKKTEDLILNQAVAPSSGFAGNRPVNLGRVDNQGIELLATVQALTSSNWDWDISASIASNRDEIKDLGGLPSVITTFGQYNRVGHAIGTFFSKRVVAADRDTAGRAINVLCADTAGRAPVACAQAPLVAIGTPTPKLSGSVSNTLTLWKNLRLYALVDFKRGHRIWNQTELIRCQGLVGVPLCDVNYNPRNYPVTYVAQAVGNALPQSIIDQFVQDASFAKLREVSATYTLPRRLIPGTSGASFTLAARELHTWTDYGGIDPEVSSAGSGGITSQDQAILPPLTRIIATLNVRF
jgi:TonB-linked SusC/RagA family outer membrane protein